MRASEKENLLLNAALDEACERLAGTGVADWTARVWRLVLLDDADKALKARKAAAGPEVAPGQMAVVDAAGEVSTFPGQVETGEEFPQGQAFGTPPVGTDDQLAEAAESYPGACPICQGTGMMLDDEDHVIVGSRCTSCLGTGRVATDPAEV